MAFFNLNTALHFLGKYVSMEENNLKISLALYNRLEFSCCLFLYTWTKTIFLVFKTENKYCCSITYTSKRQIIHMQFSLNLVFLSKSAFHILIFMILILSKLRWFIVIRFMCIYCSLLFLLTSYFTLGLKLLITFMFNFHIDD